MPEAGPSPLVALLAAGAGRRFGGGKLDAELAGRPVGQWVLDAVAAAGLEPGLIVVPGHMPEFAASSAWPTLRNICASDGLGTSLALAASAALGQGRSLLVLLADMPLVDPAHLKLLAAQDCAATLYPNGQLGVPALICAELLDHVAELEGDAGAGALLNRWQGVARVDPPADMLLDIDRPDDLARAEALLTGRG